MGVAASDFISSLSKIPGYTGDMNAPMDFFGGQTPNERLKQFGYNGDPNFQLPDPMTGWALSDFGGIGVMALPFMAAAASGALGLGAGAEAGAGAGFMGQPFGEAGVLAGEGGAAGAGGASAAGAAGGAMDMGGSAGVFDSFGNPLYTSPAGTGSSSGGCFSNLFNTPPGTSSVLRQITDNPDGSGSVRFVEGGAGGGGGPLSWLSSILGGAGGAAGSGVWGIPSSIGSLLTGLLGIPNARDLEKTGTALMDKMDPAKPIRDVAQPELIKLMQDPSSIVNRPGFAAGQLAIDRSLAKQGYNPANVRGVSGNYLDAQSNYAGNFYNQEMQRLMAMSQIGVAPSGGNLAMQGLMGSTGLTGASAQNIMAGLAGLLRNFGIAV